MSHRPPRKWRHDQGAPSRDPTREAQLVELRKLYGEVDVILAGWSCEASTECCRFGVTGREPYPSAIELAELERGLRARGGLPKRRSLPVASERRCTFLSDEGRCLVYASRPFGCRTFFCERASGPSAMKHVRGAILRVGKEIADLSARYAPGDAGPRPLSRWSRAFEGPGKGSAGRG